MIYSPEWENSLSYCVPGIYRINYWEVFMESNDMIINNNKFIFNNACFYFEVKMYSSSNNDSLVETFTRNASGEGEFIFSNGKCEIYDIKINYDYDLVGIPFLGKYSLSELREMYRKKVEIPEIGIEVFNIYVKSVHQKYETLKVEEYLHENIAKLKVSNHGHIKYDGKPLRSSIVGDRKRLQDHWENWMEQWKDYLEVKIPGIFIPYPLLLVHRLVAEVWCENPNKEIYTRVHHIGNNSKNNSENLMFVTEEQHGFIHKDNW
jgi:hypothetical protein